MNTIPTRQYIGCTFANSTRIYTYHSDLGTIFEIGDLVEVPARDGGLTTVKVVSLALEKPNFETKGVVRKLPPPPSVPKTDEEESQ